MRRTSNQSKSDYNQTFPQDYRHLYRDSNRGPNLNIGNQSSNRTVQMMGLESGENESKSPSLTGSAVINDTRGLFEGKIREPLDKQMSEQQRIAYFSNKPHIEQTYDITDDEVDQRMAMYNGPGDAQDYVHDFNYMDDKKRGGNPIVNY